MAGLGMMVVVPVVAAKLRGPLSRVEVRKVRCGAMDDSVKASSFDWARSWYPLGVQNDLDKRVPHAVRVLGYDLVLWWDKAGQSWQAFDDKCPHRLAPLSEGRIAENGELQCSYHGWCFAPGSGACTKIPQASPNVELRLAASRRACVTTYTTMEQQGLVWFSPKLDRNSALKPPYFPVLDDPAYTHYWATSELPYGYQALTENLTDPTHVHFAHHKLQGNRKAAKPVSFTVSKVEKGGFKGSTGRGGVEFVPPCSFSTEIKLSADNSKSIFTLFVCVPVAPGRSRVFWSFPRNFATWSRLFTPMWLLHLRHMIVLDSDMYFLHLMEKKQELSNACYTPTSADAFVMAFRKWLTAYAGGGPAYNVGILLTSPPTPPKHQLMDRYENHIRFCPVCKGALRGFRGMELGLQIGSLAALALLACSRASAVKNTQLGALAILLWGASRWMSHFIDKNYRFHDYNHSLIK